MINNPLRKGTVPSLQSWLLETYSWEPSKRGGYTLHAWDVKAQPTHSLCREVRHHSHQRSTVEVSRCEKCVAAATLWYEVIFGKLKETRHGHEKEDED